MEATTDAERLRQVLVMFLGTLFMMGGVTRR